MVDGDQERHGRGGTPAVTFLVTVHHLQSSMTPPLLLLKGRRSARVRDPPPWHRQKFSRKVGARCPAQAPSGAYRCEGVTRPDHATRRGRELCTCGWQATTSSTHLVVVLPLTRRRRPVSYT